MEFHVSAGLEFSGEMLGAKEDQPAARAEEEAFNQHNLSCLLDMAWKSRNFDFSQKNCLMQRRRTQAHKDNPIASQTQHQKSICWPPRTQDTGPRGVPDKFCAFTLPKLTSRFHTILYQSWKEQISCKYLCVLASSTSSEAKWKWFSTEGDFRWREICSICLLVFLQWKLMLSMRIKYSFHNVIDFW